MSFADTHTFIFDFEGVPITFYSNNGRVCSKLGSQERVMSNYTLREMDGRIVYFARYRHISDDEWTEIQESYLG